MAGSAGSWNGSARKVEFVWRSRGRRRSLPRSTFCALLRAKLIATRAVQDIGLYGVELGGFAALEAAEQRRPLLLWSSIRYRHPDDLIHSSMKEDIGLDNNLVQYLVRNAMRIYFLGKYQNIRLAKWRLP